MIEWDSWRTVLAVVRTGTYASAANALRLDATTVARRLKHLESQLGYALFVRKGDRFYPSNRCEELLINLETAADALRIAEQQTSAFEQSPIWRTLRMTAPPFLVSHLFAPALPVLTHRRRLRVELIGTASKVGLQRREADIAIRIEDRRGEIPKRDKRIKAVKLGVLEYRVYHAKGSATEGLPWAGLTERQQRTSGSEKMMAMAGDEGFQYNVSQFDPLLRIVQTGVARAMLPRIIAQGYPDLLTDGETVLTQPIWMLYHSQDQEDPHLKAARQWIMDLAATLPSNTDL